MDPPRHDEQRKTVSPIVAPANLALLEATIRERAARILDGLPIGEEFDWVQRVSIELTTQMLATLFDFPFEDRHCSPGGRTWPPATPTATARSRSWEMRRAELGKCQDYFTRLWNERVNAAAAQRPDLDAGARAGHARHERRRSSSATSSC